MFWFVKSLTNSGSIVLVDSAEALGSTECEDHGEIVELCNGIDEVGAIPRPVLNPYVLPRSRIERSGPGSESTVANEMTDIRSTE